MNLHKMLLFDLPDRHLPAQIFSVCANAKSTSIGNETATATNKSSDIFMIINVNTLTRRTINPSIAKKKTKKKQSSPIFKFTNYNLHKLKILEILMI